MTLDAFLFYMVYALILIFGILISVFFSGVHINRKNFIITMILIAFCGIVQVLAHSFWKMETVWIFYPLLVHFPTFLMLTLYWKRRVVTSIAAITTGYLCCHPPKWISFLMEIITHSEIAAMLVQIVSIVALGLICIYYFAPTIAQAFNQRPRSVAIFAMLPFTYYIFDYATSAWAAFWNQYMQLTAEFLPFMLCIAFFVFLILYQKSQEHAENAERTKQMLQFQYEQREKEYNNIQQTEREIQLMRHDMRLHLNNLSVCLDNKDIQSAKTIISSLCETMDNQRIKHYTQHTLINYILSDFEAKAKAQNVRLDIKVSLPHIELDEIRFSSILSNALENALFAQKDIPPAERYIKIRLTYNNNKLLFSVSNPTKKSPVFADGIPINRAPGHGYGTQSIRYLTEYLGGMCHFSVEKGIFRVRVII